VADEVPLVEVHHRIAVARLDAAEDRAHALGQLRIAASP
jgi:hypothetical protein